jgi:transposase
MVSCQSGDALMTVVAMSHGELSRYDTLRRFERGELRIEDAAMLLGVSRRQVYRLLGRLRSDGPEALVSWKRGRPSNRTFSAEFRTRVVDLVRENYSDFGPTLAAEYLAERHKITISHETLRKWMIAEGFWKDRDARRPRPYQPRYRRDCRGELIQIDGSKHWWFEDRGQQCTLLVYIDDATSELMNLKMVESESTFAYMDATREYIEAHGKPVAFYSDKHSVFRNNTASAKGDGMTHFGRSMEALNIEIICAHSPQAKGRVERANATLQDRLVKAMRLEGISTIAGLHGHAQCQVRQGAFRRTRCSPPTVNAREPSCRDGLARMALGYVLADAALQQGDVHSGADRDQPPSRRQAGRGLRVPGRRAGDPARETLPALPRVRQDPAGQPGRDRRQQASGCGAGDGQAAAGAVAGPQAQQQRAVPQFSGTTHISCPAGIS